MYWEKIGDTTDIEWDKGKTSSNFNGNIMTLEPPPPNTSTIYTRNKWALTIQYILSSIINEIFLPRIVFSNSPTVSSTVLFALSTMSWNEKQILFYLPRILIILHNSTLPILDLIKGKVLSVSS